MASQTRKERTFEQQTAFIFLPRLDVFNQMVSRIEEVINHVLGPVDEREVFGEGGDGDAQPRICPQCGHENEPHASSCSNCGHEFARHTREPNGRLNTTCDAVGHGLRVILGDGSPLDVDEETFQAIVRSISTDPSQASLLKQRTAPVYVSSFITDLKLTLHTAENIRSVLETMRKLAKDLPEAA
jgi:hypothetical protein